MIQRTCEEDVKMVWVNSANVIEKFKRVGQMPFGLAVTQKVANATEIKEAIQGARFV